MKMSSNLTLLCDDLIFTIYKHTKSLISLSIYMYKKFLLNLNNNFHDKD